MPFKQNSKIKRKRIRKHKTSFWHGLSQSSVCSDYNNSIHNWQKKIPLSFRVNDFVLSNWIVWRTNEWLCWEEWYNITKDNIFCVVHNEGSIAAIWYLGQATFLVLFKLSMSSVKLRPMVIQGLMGLFTGFSS